ncbi:MAG: threonine ammonia-lyase [Alphaproteobacteria bacterium]
MAPSLPDYADILDAARAIEGRAVYTPLLESPDLNARLGGRIFIKAEPLQRTGSFKFRGAFNRISRIDGPRREAGVVAYSSGNHAQGVAAAAAILGLPASIVMPSDAPDIKRRNTAALGAEIIPYERHAESRDAMAEALAEERGATLVRPFDDPMVIAGQGTVGLEIADQLEALGLRPDALLAPCSGGGLIAGCALALAERFDGVEMLAVEPVGFDDTARSLLAGERRRNEAGPTSICDALQSPAPGEITFAINRRLLSGALAVDDDGVRRAMAFAVTRLKLVLEPGGAAALAALLSGLYDCKGKIIVIVASGGNVDPETLAASLRA